MKTKILIVDDLKEIVMTMSRYFAIHGYEVDCASEREEAEALICANSYSVVITDLHLTPVRSNEGLEIVRLLHHEAPETRVIMLTAYDNEEVEKEADRYGISAFLRKPVSLPLLRQAVQESLRRLT
jgi:two-component system response regulator (stage 0 sporulation protein F)